MESTESAAARRDNKLSYDVFSQNGISEWKCIPEWKFRREVHSRVEYLRGTKWPLWASVKSCVQFSSIPMQLAMSSHQCNTLYYGSGNATSSEYATPNAKSV